MTKVVIIKNNNKTGTSKPEVLEELRAFEKSKSALLDKKMAELDKNVEEAKQKIDQEFKNKREMLEKHREFTLKETEKEAMAESKRILTKYARSTKKMESDFEKNFNSCVRDVFSELLK